MLAIGRDNQWLVKEDLLGLPKRHAMTFPVLLEIAVIPIKAGAACQGVICDHDASICQTYTRGKVGGRLTGGGSAASSAAQSAERESAAPAG